MADGRQVQRVAAYGLLVDAGEVLLVRLSAVTPMPGAWSLPGGGVDFGEHPRDTVVRETYEETGQHVEVGELLDVDSLVRERVDEDGEVEGYHAVRVLFRAHLPHREELRVVDEGGSSDAAAWWPLREARSLRLSPVAELGLSHLP